MLNANQICELQDILRNSPQTYLLFYHTNLLLTIPVRTLNMIAHVASCVCVSLPYSDSLPYTWPGKHLKMMIPAL
jgi:hypothetical protein